MKIEVNNLSKKYGEKYALDNVSFTLEKNKIYGLLGRNGAGKTTFMDILSGQILATSGEIKLDGESPFDKQKLTESICLVKESNNFPKEITIKDVLKIFSFFYPDWDQDFAEQLLGEFNLTKKLKVKTLSKGMESALGITVGLASRAPITVFDEPYIGMDAPSRKRFYELLLEDYQVYPRTFIFSTHLIDEVSLMFEEVLILREGTLALQEDSEVLRDKTVAVTGPTTKVDAYLQGKEVIERKDLAGNSMAYTYGTKEEAMAAGLQVEGVPIQELMIHLTERKGA
ncbi:MULTISPECIES: ABC transporter ATP-binding protein [Oceanobacillus]|uniref:ABC transporter ATP-binding protein n=1 Tax=Oceanobacillus kimchii TaxID=746691 RepID=A0ABQ5TET1_9BACI|nr:MULTISPECIES: ABC transporter ATP-binding protein [Oceanobacillus]MBT2601372.1 ABC transporter ATP-binding protein [Oceanobacillus sp. ISL-74]MBT2653462.1 ABC transporter ATP-binding protein [Oceanobacillus sp. ISL-73]OEH53243.1 ABC transporter ATP-binding protein [Oceanobacillus sp. E9]GLO65349.1 ABC transporter ATP-binding protein [Oceanobacillus kimchii]